MLALAAMNRAQERTVMDGVFTSGQAARGGEGYRTYCRKCHGGSLEGGPVQDLDDPAPALRRDGFGVSRGSLGALYNYLIEFMPYDAPGGLEERAYTDIIAYIMQENGYPAGSTELVPNVEVLKTIRVVRKP
jgi:hypothetical protein